MTTTLLLALLLSPSLAPEHEAIVMTYALAKREGISPEMAVCIMLRESGGHTWAVGDEGAAVGLWQWHLTSWEHIQRARGLPMDDRRAELLASTEAAIWALANGYEGWWSAYPLCTCEQRISQ